MNRDDQFDSQELTAIENLLLKMFVYKSSQRILAQETVVSE